MSTGRRVQGDRQMNEIKRTSSWRDPNVGDRTPELARVRRRHDSTIALLFVLSVLCLVAGVAMASIGAWLVGVVSFVLALSVDTRHERELRDIRRSSELGSLRRRRLSSTQIRALQSAVPRFVTRSDEAVALHSLAV